MNVIEIKDLIKVFSGKPVLKNLTMTVRQGEIYGFLGPNGAGKTTTLRILLGLLNPTSGDIRIFDRNPFVNGGHVRKKLGIVPENTGFYDWLDPIGNLHFYAQLYGVDASRNRLRHQLAQVGLDPDDQHPVRTYSKGMKQRLALARILVHDPEVLILDEPTSGLDPRGRREVHDLLRSLSTDRDKTIILSTHILDDVETLCDSIGILCAGRLQYQGPAVKDVEEIYFKYTEGRHAADACSSNKGV